MTNTEKIVILVAVAVLISSMVFIIAMSRKIMNELDKAGEADDISCTVETMESGKIAEPILRDVVFPAEEKGEDYLVTAYCACVDCCGKSDGITATGAVATEGRTIAVDPTVIPYGTEVVIDGNTYIAEDCGGLIKGKRIDLYFESHEAAKAWGSQTKEVIINDRA